jgi:hypothetical protein
MPPFPAVLQDKNIYRFAVFLTFIQRCSAEEGKGSLVIKMFEGFSFTLRRLAS